ncbi:hypothetical protein NDU88_004465 [Pleurodeles waltl]|uniref:Uncharacterized protein n=1 Tax=Pleurodeles waltl TaxID=8319 RepID=A0AAV7NL52_PLEWA|nr:hypothetical protein NDU88_004465 [Pleurodeles waltl]
MEADRAALRAPRDGHTLVYTSGAVKSRAGRVHSYIAGSLHWGPSCGIRQQLDQEVSAVERWLLRHELEVIQNPGTLSELQAVHKTHSDLIERLRSLNYTARSANTHAKVELKLYLPD